MSRIMYTKRELAQMRGYCTGPHDGAPAPGDVGLDYKAACCTCSKRVKVTARGLYSHHKAADRAAHRKVP